MADQPKPSEPPSREWEAFLVVLFGIAVAVSYWMLTEHDDEALRILQKIIGKVGL